VLPRFCEELIAEFKSSRQYPPAHRSRKSDRIAEPGRTQLASLSDLL
jgi:hypothetical protein